MSMAAREILNVAVELSKACGDGLVVLIVTSTSESVRQFQKEANEVLNGRGVDVRYRTIASLDVKLLPANRQK
jgi:hypothetical protein